MFLINKDNKNKKKKKKNKLIKIRTLVYNVINKRKKKEIINMEIKIKNWIKNGDDYECNCNGHKYEISRSYGLWTIYEDSEVIETCIGTIKEAKAFIKDLNEARIINEWKKCENLVW